MIFRIIDLRAYAKAKQIYDTTEMEKRPKGHLMDIVSEITMGLAKKRIEQAQKEENESND